MTSRNRRIEFLPGAVVLLSTWVLFLGCSSGPELSVSNQSSVTLSNVVVSGPGFTMALGTLNPGEVQRRIVHPNRDSSVRLQFDAAGRHMDSGQLGYFEDSALYRVSLTVTTNLEVIEVTN